MPKSLLLAHSIFLSNNPYPGLEVIKLEFILKLKIKRNDCLLADTCRKQPIIVLYFEFETVRKFYNLEARTSNVEDWQCFPIFANTINFLDLVG